MKACRLRTLAIAVVAMSCIFLSTANAQESVTKNSHFTLPFQAAWANTVLPPGDYTLSVVQRSEDRGLLYTVTVEGAGKKQTILALKPQGLQVGARSMLVIESIGGIRSIRALHLPDAGLVLTFPASRAQRETVAKAPRTLQSIPVLAAVK
jgi:hypothetical protein